MGFFKKRKNPFADIPMDQLEGELWIIGGKKLGERWRLIDDGDEFLVGRHLEDEDDISFDNDAKTVSKRHCIFRKTGSAFECEDLGSSNGTFLNKKTKVEGTVELFSGDEITLGINESVIRFTAIDIEDDEAED